METFQKIRYKIGKIISGRERNLYQFNDAKNLSFEINPRTLSFKTLVLLILTTLNLSASLYALGNNIKFENISIEQGLSQSTVSCILQDSTGFMWFGTEDGLNKYDGYSFIIYKNDLLDLTSLSDSYILSIYEDKSGVLWIGTEGGGLNKFSREKEQFTHYRHNPNNPNSLSNNYVRSINEDRAGVLWIGTKDGLDKFDREKEQFTHYKHDPNNPNSLSNNFVNSIYEDRAGVLWIGTEDGLSKFDLEKEQFTHYRHDPNNPNSLSNNYVRSINEDRAGVLWIGTDDGLDKFDREKEQFTYYRHDPNNPNSLSNNFVNSIYEDRAGVLWIGTFGGGFNRFDREKEKFDHWVHEPGIPNSLSNNFVNSIYEDRTGVLWIGTFGGGFSRFDLEKRKFMHYVHDPNDSNSLSTNIIFSIYEDRTGVLWIGTYGGLDKFDREKGKFIHYRHDPNNLNSLSNDYVRSIYEDRAGVLWIGTYDGLNKFDREKGKLTHYRHDPNNPNSLSNNYVRSIYEDRAGVLWIGTFGGLNKFNREKGKFTNYKHDPDNPNSLSNDRAVSICEDRAGVLWIGTGGGLNKFDREKEQFTHYKYDKNNPDSMSNDRVLSIYEDKTGVLWLGTYGGGINRFDREKEKFTYYREKDGLPNDVIYGILEDDKGNLWISTNKGLSKFNPQTKTFRNYDVYDGLQSNEFNSGAYHKSKNGEMFFGGVNGFNVFYPNLISDNPHIPHIVITGFQIFNKSVHIGEEEDGRSILKKSITETEAIELSYKDRIFSFEFSALHYASPEKNAYAYMMEGFEKNWNYVGNRRFVTYTNLPPKDYIFRVKGSNNDGVWNEEGTSLKITVIPPFWQTWWFRVLGIIAILLLILMVYKIRTRSIREQSKRLENRVEERTAELNIANEELQKEITERKRLEQRAHRRAAQGALIYKVGQRVSSELELEALLHEIVSAVRVAFDYYGVMMLMFDEETERLTLQSITGGHADIMPKDLSVAIGEGMIGYAAATGETQISGDVRKEPRYLRKANEATKSELSVPIKSSNKVIGVLDIQSDEFDAFDETDVTAVETLSTQIATAIENAHLYKKAQREITERKRAEEQIKASLREKEVLLKEIHHRVKNNMQIISSLLNIQSSYIKDQKVLEMFKKSRDRIRSMALIHEKLYQSKDLSNIDFAQYIQSLTLHLFNSYRVDPNVIKLKTDMEDVSLDINMAIPCALIINELVSNSLKHAFPEDKAWGEESKSKGEICISLRSDDKGVFRLIIRDNGVGLPKDLDFQKTESMGLQLVSGLVEQLNGSIELQRGDGTAFKITYNVPK